MSVLQRRELEDSPLADLHAIASEIGIEGYRTLRREQLIAAVLRTQGGEAEAGDSADEEGAAPAEDVEASEDAEVTKSVGVAEEVEVTEAQAEPAIEVEPEPESGPDPGDGVADAEPVTGTLDILPNGSGFIRLAGAGQSEGDVYISPAQIRRCELRAGDEVEGPVRTPRRSERHPSLVRVERVNGRDAEPPEQRPHFADLTPIHPAERLPAPSALDLTPFGKGSRVAIAGGPGAGATRLLHDIARALAEADGRIQLSVVLVGARPEEVTEWEREDGLAVAGGSFDRSLEAQTQAVELAVERAKRAVERGGDAAVIVDSLEPLPPGAARRLFGAARNLEQGGSLTVFAAVGGATEPLRQASTRITLDAAADEPTVLAAHSGTQRADLLG